MRGIPDEYVTIKIDDHPLKLERPSFVMGKKSYRCEFLTAIVLIFTIMIVLILIDGVYDIF